MHQAATRDTSTTGRPFACHFQALSGMRDQHTSARASSHVTLPPLSRSTATAVSSASGRSPDPTLRKCPMDVLHATANATRAGSSGSERRNAFRSIGPLHHTVKLRSTPFGDSGAIHCAMAEDSEIRRANFRALWDRRGWSPATLSKQCGASPSQWSDLYHGRKSFGEKIARRIEEGMGLVRLSLDDPEGGRAAPLSADLMRRLADLDPAQGRRVENSIRAMLDMPAITDLNSPLGVDKRFTGWCNALQRAAIAARRRWGWQPGRRGKAPPPHVRSRQCLMF